MQFVSTRTDDGFSIGRELLRRTGNSQGLKLLVRPPFNHACNIRNFLPHALESAFHDA